MVSINPAIKKKIIDAANSLKTRGESVTNEAIRAEMGGGSLTHISPVMREWRQEQEKASTVILEMPQSVRRSMEHLSAELWRAADQEARKRIEIIESDCNERIAVAETERDEVLGEVSRLEEENAKKNQEIAALNKEIQSAQAENKAISSEFQTTLLHLERSKVETEAAREAKSVSDHALKAANENIRELQKELVNLAQQSAQSANIKDKS